MTEQQGEQIGRLWTEIGGDLTPLEEALQQGAKLLANFIAKEYSAKIGVQFEESGGAQLPRQLVDRHGRQLGAAIGQAALGNIEGKLSNIKDVKVEATPKIDKDTLISAMQGSLNGHAFKITLDQNYIREQVQQALGHGFQVGVGGGVPLAPQRGGLSDEQRREFDQRFAAGKYSKEAARPSELISSFAQEVRDALGLAASGKGPTADLEDVISALGDDFNTWGEKLTSLAPDREDLGSLAEALVKKINPTRSEIIKDIFAAKAQAPVSAPQSVAASSQFVAQVARKLAQEAPSGVTASEAAAEKTLAEIKRTPFFANPTSLKDIFGGLASNREPDPEFKAILGAALSADRNVSDAISGGRNTRSARYGGRGLVKGPFGGPLSTGSDPEADLRAASQLGVDRSNPRRLRGRAAGIEGIAFDLEGLARTLERGGLRNIVRETKTGNLREIEPSGATPGELIESDAAIRELRKRTGSKPFTLPSVEGQVQFLKPQEVVEQIVKGMFGGEAGEGILNNPEFSRTIRQAISQGSRNKPFDFLGSAAGATRLGGTSPQAAAAEVLRLQGLVKQNDAAVAQAEERLANLQGSGKPTDRIEARLDRLILKGNKLRTELEAVTPNTDRSLSPGERQILAAGASRSRAESRQRIAESVGLSPIERALKAEGDESAIAATISSKMHEGLLPAYEDLIDRLSTAVETAVPRGEAGENQFSARFRAFAEETQSILRDFGLTDDKGKNARGRGEDRRLFNALLGEARSSIFTERQIKSDEGDRAADLLHAGTGKGRVPKTQIGSSVDLSRTSTLGQAVQVPQYARPTTSLDTERQTLQKKYDDEALRVAQRKFEESQQLRGGRLPGGFEGPVIPVDKEFREGFGSVEDFLRVPRVRKAEAGGQRSTRSTTGGYRPDIISEVESSTDVGKRVAEIRRIQREADEFLKIQGPPVPLSSGRKRSSVDERIAFLEQQGQGLDPAVLQEALEVTRQNLAGKRTPYTKAGREVPTGTQTAEAFAAAAEGRQRRQTSGGVGTPLKPPIGGGGGVSGGGGGFGPFPIPLPVSIVQSIPLTIMGGGGVPAAAEDGGRQPRGVPSAAEKAEEQATGNRGGRIALYRDPTIAPRRLIPAEPSGLGRQRQAALLAQQRQAARAGRGGRVLTDFDIRSEYLDRAQDESENIAGQQRRARRLVPSRGFGASITDALTSLVGGKGFEAQLGRLSRVETEGAELRALRNQRAGLTAEAAVLNRRRQSASPEERAAITNQLRGMIPTFRGLNAAIERSTKKFTENYEELTKGTNVAKGFIAAGFGSVGQAIAGSVTFGLGLAVTGPIIQAIGQGFTEVAGSSLERFLGYPSLAGQQQTELGQATRAAGGRAEIAFAQQQIQTGLGPSQAELIGPVTTQRAAIEAGNQAFRDQLDQFRAFERYKEQNRGTIGDAALTKNLTGFLGTSFGGTPSFGESLGDLFQDVPDNFGGGPSKADQEQIANLQAAIKRYEGEGNSQPVLETLNLLRYSLHELEQGIEGSSDAIDFFTKRAKDSGVDLKAIAGGTLTPEQRQAQASALAEAGLDRVANQVLAGKVGFQNQAGQNITDPRQFVDLLTKIATATPKPSPEALLDTQAPQLRAQLFLLEKQRGLTLQTNRISEGIDVGAQPFLPATAGFAPQDAKKYSSELKGVQAQFDLITKEAAAARSEAVDFFRNAFPGNETAANDFAASLQKSAQYGQQIADIQLGVETAQAALAAKQYAFQISQVRRSLQDALGLQGKITSGAENLGVIERQQFELQRDAQALSLAQSQRQINFQRSIAGLTAPGLTGEERAARIEQAKLEADYAQKQLDIQKKLFGLGGKQFQITADRNVQDLTRNLELLQQGREVTLKTQVAAKQIQALTKLQDRENKKIQAFYQSAVDATGQVLQLEAQLVAQTEVGLNKVGNLVLDQFRKVYGGLIAELGGGGGGGGGGGQLPKMTASGGLFETNGPAMLGNDRIVGEAGGETVAVISHPRTVTGSFSGGGTTQVVIDLRGANVSDEDLLRKLTTNVQAAVERGLAKKGNLLGLRN